VTPKPEFQNQPQLLTPKVADAPGKITDLAEQIAGLLKLTPKKG
jgi:hypothetical protein